MNDGIGRRRGALRDWTDRAVEGLVVLAAYTVLIGCAEYALYAQPGTTIFAADAGGIADINLGMAILSWEWRALTTMPTALFDLPVFHPVPRMLAGAEHALGLQPIYGPVFALSGNPVLAWNMNHLLSLAASAAAMYALLRHWGLGRGPAFFGGFVWGAAPSRMGARIAPQLVSGHWLPLALLSLDRVVCGGARGWAIAFGLFTGLHLLTSYYAAYMGAFVLASYALVALWVGRGEGTWRRAAVLVPVLAVVAAAFVAVSLPYLTRRDAGVIKTYAGTAQLHLTAAHWWQNYLYPPFAMHRWGWRLFRGPVLYTGIVPLLLAALAFGLRRRAPVPAPRWAVPAALTASGLCWALSLGTVPPVAWFPPALMPYSLALVVVPGFSSMRSPGRFGIGAMLGIAALAGVGLDRLVRGRARPVVIGATLLALGAVWVEFDLPDPTARAVTLPSIVRPPRIYSTLRRLPPGPVLELPIGGQNDLGGVLTDSQYMYHAIFHGHPMLNGYTGYAPPSYASVIALARALPDPRALDLLVRLTGLRYVLVHAGAERAATHALWRKLPGVRVLALFSGDLLLSVTRPPPSDLVEPFVDFRPRETTLLGTPATPLGDDGRANAVDLVGPAPSPGCTSAPFRFEVRVTNRSERPWPALASVAEHLVGVSARFDRVDGGAAPIVIPVSRLPYDLAPGESVQLTVGLIAPPRPGEWRLSIGVSQDGQWFPETMPPLVMSVAPLGG